MGRGREGRGREEEMGRGGEGDRICYGDTQAVSEFAGEWGMRICKGRERERDTEVTSELNVEWGGGDDTGEIYREAS